MKIEFDVKSCSQCPYFCKENDMGAIIFFCSNLKDIIGDLTFYNYDRVISKKCPIKKESVEDEE